MGSDLLEAELVRLDREPPAVLVQVDEAAMAFETGREARDFEVTEGHAEVVGEGHHIAEFEVARDWWLSGRIERQGVLGTLDEVLFTSGSYGHGFSPEGRRARTQGGHRARECDERVNG